MLNHIPAILHELIEVADIQRNAQAFFYVQIQHFAVSEHACFTEHPLDIREAFTAGLHDN